VLDAPGRGIMSESKTQQEPSMEEILASIRRIISEDGDEDAGDANRDRAAPEEARRAQDGEPALALTEEAEDDPPDEAPEASAEDDDEPLELSDIVEDEPEPAPEEEGAEASADDIDAMFASSAAADDPLPTQPEPEPEPESPPRAERPQPPPEPQATQRTAAMDDALISPATETAAGAAFARLLEQTAEREATMAARTALGNGDKTLEDLVKELLRPMLSEWLDAHLPDIVERVVEREVERVGRNADRR